MNTESNDIHIAPLDASLRLQLRGLRRDQEPARDLWPDIAARIAAPVAASPRRRNASRYAPWALAASLVLSLGVAWRMQPPPVAIGAMPADSARAGLSMDREADAMTREYHAALQELQASTPDRSAARPEQPALRQLDQSARQIRTALARDPDARFLLERLRHTYTLRLELTQRASMS
jgi:hypothetical protein